MKTPLSLGLVLIAILLSACGEQTKVEPPKLGEQIAEATFVGLDGSRTVPDDTEDK